MKLQREQDGRPDREPAPAEPTGKALWWEDHVGRGGGGVANKTLQEKFWSHLRELDFVLRAMGRNLGTVSKGVKDLWLLCGE